MINPIEIISREKNAEGVIEFKLRTHTQKGEEWTKTIGISAEEKGSAVVLTDEQMEASVLGVAYNLFFQHLMGG